MTSTPPQGGQWENPTSSAQYSNTGEPVPQPPRDQPAAQYQPPAPGHAQAPAYPPPAYGQPQGYGQPQAYAPPSSAQPGAYQAPWAPVVPPNVPAPPYGWAAVVAGVLAIIGCILPWFHPHVGGVSADESIHVWDDGRLGLVGPVVLVVAGVLWAKVLLKPGPREEIDRAIKTTLAGGILGLASVVIAYFLVPHNYSDWYAAQSYAESIGDSLGRGPQLGLWLVVLASIDALALAAICLTVGKPTPSGPASIPPPGAPQYPAAGGYPALQQYPAPQQYPGQQYPAPQQYPGQQQYPAPQQYPASQQYPAQPPYPAPQQHPGQPPTR